MFTKVWLSENRATDFQCEQTHCDFVLSKMEFNFDMNGRVWVRRGCLFYIILSAILCYVHTIASVKYQLCSCYSWVVVVELSKCNWRQFLFSLSSHSSWVWFWYSRTNSKWNCICHCAMTQRWNGMSYCELAYEQSPTIQHFHGIYAQKRDDRLTWHYRIEGLNDGEIVNLIVQTAYLNTTDIIAYTLGQSNCALFSLTRSLSRFRPLNVIR